MKHVLLLAVLPVIGVLLSSSPAFSQNVINACVKPSQGQMRIVQANEPCAPNEIKVAWNTSDQRVTRALLV
jgi:hypothetical protein